jgi:N-acyl amino acid synthase of PEP-CTERM/exosortase system
MTFSMFDQYFEVFLADNAEGREINYRTRYRVYCLETGYEDPARYPEKTETDAFDQHSVHFIARARSTGEWIAALRLVIRPFDSLPMNAFSNVDFSFLSDEITRDIQTGQTSLCCEVSRLCVISSYRRRAQERTTPYQMSYNPDRDSPPANTSDPSERRKAPWLMLGLINAARDYSETHNIRYWFFLVADALARIMEGLGFGLTTVGPVCEHRGKRRPYFRDLNTRFENIAERLPIVYEMFTRPSGYRLYSELRDDQKEIPLISSNPR